MCGIAGFLDPTHRIADRRAPLRLMAEVLRRRGPDDQGVWCDEAAGIGLAHARLSVIDLSPEGSQPMTSSSGRYTISFNGEIYNFRALRAELEAEGVSFRGDSDTEVLIEGIQQLGVETMVRRCTGMFAFAVWDAEERRLSLVRDRIGIKPLYWSCSGELALFGSELKALLASGHSPREIDEEAVSAYLTLGYVPAPHSIFKGIRKLGPGQILHITRSEGRLRTDTHCYWSATRVAIESRSDPLVGSDQSMLDHLDDVIGTAVGDRMVADVPLGAFLSGGIDSTLVVAMMQERSAVPVRTFTIGFNEELYDESGPARRIAEHLGTDHTELVVTSADSLDVVPRIPDLYDEPFADSSQIPTFLVSQLARTEVTVSLSGDGGDELFGGYDRYVAGHALFDRFTGMPTPIRRLFGRGLRSIPQSGWMALYGLARALSLGRLRPRQLGLVMHKLAQSLEARDNREFYQLVLAIWRDASSVYPSVPFRSCLDEEVFHDDFDFAEQMFLADTKSYLVDDILVKVDRASMGVSLEARVPLLDHRVYEAAWRLPMSLRLHNRTGKVALRTLLERRVPRSFFDRPKKGFGVPVADWLRNDLRDWSESLLAPADLESIGLDPVVVRSVWERHLGGHVDFSARIWAVLMLRAWHERWMKGDVSPRGGAS